MEIESVASRALCGVMERALIAEGIDPALAATLARRACMPVVEAGVAKGKATVKKKVSRYNRKYKAAFRKVSSRYRTKSGKWKAGGFKAAVKAAHKEAKK